MFEATEPTVDYHSHDYLELGYVQNGQLIHTFEGNTTIISPGDYYIVDYGKLHSYELIGDTPLSVLNCMFIPRLFDETLSKKTQLNDISSNHLLKFNLHTLTTQASNIIFHDDSGYIRELLLRMAKEYEDKKLGYQEILRSHLITILIETIRRLDNCVDFENDIVLKATQYMDTHFTEKALLQNLSKKYNYSLSYVSRIFKQETGKTIQQHLRSIRVHEACRLLANTTIKISAIAERIGYEDAKFFTKIFKEETGMTPREFRNTHSTNSY